MTPLLPPCPATLGPFPTLSPPFPLSLPGLTSARAPSPTAAEAPSEATRTAPPTATGGGLFLPFPPPATPSFATVASEAGAAAALGGPLAGFGGVGVTNRSSVGVINRMNAGGLFDPVAADEAGKSSPGRLPPPPLSPSILIPTCDGSTAPSPPPELPKSLLS